jgi:FAD binding domain
MNFKGKIIHKNHPDYEEARVGRVFNHRRPDRFPEAVFFPENELDVIEAVKYAKQNQHKIAIRAGGHSWAAWSVRETGILLDLQHLNKITFDKNTNIVSAGPATKGGQELNPFLKKYDRMFCGGHCPTVGIGGFLLQGGQGWNARGWGWAAEYIVAIDVVTSNGELLRADCENHSDLFWAARGAGPGFFGVVVCFHLKTVAFPKAIFACTNVYPAHLGKSIIDWWQGIHGTISPNVELVLLGQTMPFNNEIKNVFIVHSLVLEVSEEKALEALKPMQNCPFNTEAYVVRDFYQTTFAEQLLLQTEANPEGHRWAVNNAWLSGDSELISEKILPAFTKMPTPKTFSLLYSMAPLRTLPDMAFSMQTEIYYATYVIWENETDDLKNQNWLNDILKNIKPITAGQYLGDSDLKIHHRKFMSDKNWIKLQEIRSKYDKDELFHTYACKTEADLNKNIFE